MTRAVAGTVEVGEIHLIPHHLGWPLLLSLVTIGLGYAAYRRVDLLRARVAGVLTAIGWGPDRGFDQGVAGIVRIAAAVTGLFQSGRLEYYVTATVVFTALALLIPMVGFGTLPSAALSFDLTLYEAVIMAMAVIGLVAVLIARTRLIAIVSLGIQGFAVALIFMLYGAPDLSFTQFMVETLSVVILALVMTRLNLVERDHRPTLQRTVDGVIALAAGSAFALILLAVVQQPFDGKLSDFFDTYSRTIAHGRNVVNVIIVDFRGLDTLGEIAVVMVTGLAILALVRISRRARVAVVPEDGDVANETAEEVRR